MQQTPKPSAHDPDSVPPALSHSAEVKHVPFRLEPMHGSFLNFIIWKIENLPAFSLSSSEHIHKPMIIFNEHKKMRILVSILLLQFLKAYVRMILFLLLGCFNFG